MSQRGIVDPSQPTAKEIASHNMKVMKCNLACDVVKAILPVCAAAENLHSADGVANFAIAVSESIIEKYSLMQEFENSGRVS